MNEVVDDVRVPEGVDIQTFNTVMNWDLSRVRARMEHDQGLPDGYLQQIEKEWKKYIILLYLNPGVKFPMSDPVDRLAHEHINDTRNFEELCQMVIPGYTIHHQPTINEAEKEELLPSYHSLTIPEMEKHFGEANPDFWPRMRCVCTYDAERRSCY